MTQNPAYSPDTLEATTTLSRVLDKEMQETMVRCTKETKDDLRDTGQCMCWTGGGGGRGRNSEEGSFKAAFQQNRCILYTVTDSWTELFQREDARSAVDLCAACCLVYQLCYNQPARSVVKIKGADSNTSSRI